MMSNNLATRSKESEVFVKPGCKFGFVVLHRRMQRRSSRSEARAFSLVDKLNWNKKYELVTSYLFQVSTSSIHQSLTPDPFLPTLKSGMLAQMCKARFVTNWISI